MSPLYANPLRGTVVQSTGEYDTRRILTENWLVDNATWGPTSNRVAHGAGEDGTTYRTITPLDITIGPYERALIKYHIWWLNQATERCKFQLFGTADHEMNRATVTGVAPNQDKIDEIIKAEKTFTTGEVLLENLANAGGVATATAYMEVDMITENSSTANNLQFRFSQKVNGGEDLTIIRGSHVEVCRF
jgi:hypothetical protein